MISIYFFRSRKIVVLRNEVTGTSCRSTRATAGLWTLDYHLYGDFLLR